MQFYMEQNIGSKIFYKENLNCFFFAGPILTEALPLPHRRAFNRGISESTVKALMTSKQAPKSTVQSPEAGTSWFGKSTVPKLSRTKSKAEVAESRKQRLKEVAEKNRKTEAERPKSTGSAQVGFMKSSKPKHGQLLEVTFRSYAFGRCCPVNGCKNYTAILQNTHMS